MAAALGPAYLIHGDDESAIAERRARLKALARERPQELALEAFEGQRCNPQQAATAAGAMALGPRRVLLFDGVERWRGEEVRRHLAPALSPPPAGVTFAFFAIERGRTKVCAELVELVRAVGGSVSRETQLHGAHLEAWVRDQARRRNLDLPPEAVAELCLRLGSRRAQILRELERLELDGAAGRPQSPVQPGSLPASAYALPDALLRGDRRGGLALLTALLTGGERPASLIYLLAARLRQAYAVAVALRSGTPPTTVRRTLRMPQRPAQDLLAQAGRIGPERLARAVVVLSELEAATHGAPTLRESVRRGGQDEQTLLLKAWLRLAALCA